MSETLPASTPPFTNMAVLRGFSMLTDTGRRGHEEAIRQQEFVIKAMTVGIDRTDAERLLAEWTHAEADFLLNAHLMGVNRDTAVRILTEVPRRWANAVLEQAAISRDPSHGTFTTEHARRTAIASGRHREGGPGDWYASITWHTRAWDALHGGHPPKRKRQS
jgi:hypothetical protein